MALAWLTACQARQGSRRVWGFLMLVMFLFGGTVGYGPPIGSP
jgi:hypothetical protein